MSGRPPILRAIAESFESERLVIRVPRSGDGEAVHAAVEESLTELEPWMPWAHEPRSADVFEAYARNAYADFVARRDIPLLLFLRDGTFVGGSGLHNIDWSVPRSRRAIPRLSWT